MKNTDSSYPSNNRREWSIFPWWAFVTLARHFPKMKQFTNHKHLQKKVKVNVVRKAISGIWCGQFFFWIVSIISLTREQEKRKNQTNHNAYQLALWLVYSSATISNSDNLVFARSKATDSQEESQEAGNVLIPGTPISSWACVSIGVYDFY